MPRGGSSCINISVSRGAGLSRNRNQCEPFEMLKIAIVRGDQREVPLESRGGNPRVGRREGPACATAIGHNVSPEHTRIFVWKQGRAEVDVMDQFLAPP